jgi:hypothetical protein
VLSKLDGPRFVENCVRWAAHEPKRAVRVSVVGGQDDFAAFLAERGFDARNVKALPALDNVDVLVFVKSNAADAKERVAVEKFVERGGGLFVAETPWGWLQLHPGQSLATDNAGNALLMKAGLAWVDGTLDATASGAFTIGDVPDLVHAARAIEALSQPDSAEKWPRARAAQARWSIVAPLAVLPRDDTVLRPKLVQLRAKAASAVPSAKAPLKDDAILARLALALELEEALAAAPEDCRAHPASALFPGAVPADAPRVTRTITIDTRTAAWHSTGLYAAAGEVIEAAANKDAKGAGLSLQIGAHTDDLTDKDQWKRCPRVVVKAPFASGKARLASPFGGLRVRRRCARPEDSGAARDHGEERRRGAALRARRNRSGGVEDEALLARRSVGRARDAQGDPDAPRERRARSRRSHRADAVLGSRARRLRRSRRDRARSRTARALRRGRADQRRLHALRLSDHDAPRRRAYVRRSREARGGTRTAAAGASTTRWDTTIRRASGPSTEPER